MTPPLHNPRLVELTELAARRAGQRGVAAFGPEFYLESLLLNAQGLPVKLLHELGIAVDDLTIDLLTQIKRSPAPPVDSFPDEAAQRAIMRADAIAAQFEHDWVGQTHLLLALVQETDAQPGNLLKKYGVEFTPLRDLFLGRLTRDQAAAPPLPPPVAAVRSPLLTTLVKETPRLARLWRRQEYHPEDLLASLLHRGQGRAIQIMRELGVDLVELALALEARSEVGEEDSPPVIGASALAQSVIAHSREVAEALRHAEIDTEHLLIALLRVDSLASELLREFELDEMRVRRQLSKAKTSSPAGWRPIEESGL